ncbi:hypothetical protein K4K56_001058 [Colletotrichum sp. SAR 10_98]|nr:hypothetical protein K4K56_001058 [Colletotrichum sp. SAR 10_98]
MVTQDLPRLLALVYHEVYDHNGTQEQIELAHECALKLDSLTLLYGYTKAKEYQDALASAALRGPPPDPILTDLRKRATVMASLLEAAQAGHVTDDILEEEAVRAVSSSQEPNVMEAHFRELRRIHESQWQQKKREERAARNNRSSYLDNISGRQEILEQIQEAEYLVQIPITPTTRFSKLEKKYFSKAVWSALWVTPFNSLQDFSRKISRHEIRWFDIRNLFLAITDDLPDVMDIVNNANTTISKPHKSRPPPIVFVLPLLAHERDDYKCRALGTEHNEVAHAYPQKKIELAGVCARKIECLAFLFGQQKIQEYQDALRSGYLESPANLIALDEGVRTMWDQCKITLRVKSLTRTKTRAPARYRWENDLTVTPADVLFDLTQKPSVLEESSVSGENTTFSGPADMDLVSTATQQHFQDGSTFKVYAEDPKLRPDPILLDLRDKLAVMASLLGATEYIDDDDDHGNDSEGTRQSAVDEAEDYQSVDGDISDMGEDLYMDDDNYGYDSDE